MIALTKEDTAILIEKIEDKASGTVIARDVLDLKTLDVHKSHGYMTLTQSYGVLMAKPMKKAADLREIYSDRFYLTSVDLF